MLCLQAYRTGGGQLWFAAAGWKQIGSLPSLVNSNLLSDYARPPIPALQQRLRYTFGLRPTRPREGRVRNLAGAPTLACRRTPKQLHMILVNRNQILLSCCIRAAQQYPQIAFDVFPLSQHNRDGNLSS